VALKRAEGAEVLSVYRAFAHQEIERHTLQRLGRSGPAGDRRKHRDVQYRTGSLIAQC
jgi:hypothetical protein